MFAVGIRFVAGQRYHATPWDAHVNEGRVEWPPSPWRLLRTVVAAWHLRGRRASQLPAEGIVQKLASRLPLYVVPREGVVGFHTRHYYPWEKQRGKQETVLVFDAFLDLGEPRIEGWRPAHRDASAAQPWHAIVLWPEVELEPDESRALDELLGCLNYFGRAESLAELAAVALEPGLEPPWRWSDEEQRRRRLFVVRPLEEGQPPPQHSILEPVRLLAPVEDYHAWRQQQTGAQQPEKPQPQRRRGRRNENATLDVPPDKLLKALEMDTEAWRSAGWPRPPGSRWVTYLCPRPEGAPVRPPRRPAPGSQGRPTVARFAVHGPVPPSLCEAVLETEKLRRKLMGRSRGPDGRPSPTFSGKASDGTPLRDHQHAYFLAEAVEWPRPRGAITHLNLYAPHGFDERAAQVLAQRLGKLWGRGGYDLELVLLALGEPQELAARDMDDVRRGRSPLFAQSRVWVSRTPFVPTHPKTTRTRGGRKHRNGGPPPDRRADPSPRRIRSSWGEPAARCGCGAGTRRARARS